MKFVCERCHTRYSIADDKVRQKILKIRCKTCENVITVREPAGGAAPPAPPGPRAPAPAPRTSPPPPPAVREWFVAINGNQAGPLARGEAAQRIVAASADDEIYVWKEDLDGWKEPKDVPAILHEVNSLRSLEAPTPASRPAPPLPAAGRGKIPAPARGPAAAGARPTGKHGAGAGMAAKAGAGARGGAAGAAASLAQQAPSFDEEDRTQIQPLDAAWLASEVAPGRAPAGRGAGSVLPFKGGGPNGADAGPMETRSSLDGLFRDSPAAAMPGLGGGVPVPGFNGQGSGAMARPGAFAPPMRAESGLSRLSGVPGFLSRNPSFKFMAAGVVMVVLIALVWVGLQSRPPEQAAALPATRTSPAAKAEPFDEEKTRLEAERRFRASVADVPPQPRIEKVEPPRRPVARSTRPSAPAVTPAPLEPGSFNADQPPVAAGGPLPGNERRVPAFNPNRAASPPATSEPTDIMISAVVNKRENRAAIKACYDRALKRDERLRSGRIDVKATVGMSGMVRQVSLHSPPEFSTVESCIRTSVKRWAFPANIKEYNVEFPLVFQGTL